MGKELSYVKQMQLIYLGVGILWTFASILSLSNSRTTQIIAGVMVLGCILIIVYILRVKKEDGDELSEENMCKAKARTLDCMHYIFAVLLVAAVLLSKATQLNLGWGRITATVLFIETGLRYLLVGFFFSKLEEG